ncbi:hypothetical protein [Arenicella sp. 4NH20-0111]|uniref:hypothetical protein n=1 Tax=Arenicella sp. 4NH20-0111 TaxID=3127648 RepID=UPI003341C8B1
MKLKFKKDEFQNISVVHQLDNGECSFSYVEMIKHLISFGNIVEPEFDGDFTDAEKESVASMSKYINEAMTELREEWDDED